jgi:sterol desaturase/sphingolipid hydroxylase (fatty acid hydroxylase superfamily)
MSRTFILQIAVFWILAFANFSLSHVRRTIKEKNAIAWALDFSGLIIQGTLIPLLQIYLVAGGLFLLAPDLKGIWQLSTPAQFLLNFVLVDYAYYLMHRAFHTKWLWPIHSVHHSAEAMDVFVSSRNSLWTSFFIPYLWLNGLFVFLLANPVGYLSAIVTTAMLDLWRHSELFPRGNSFVVKALRLVFISPREHAWHHSKTNSRTNFSANLALWDRLHNTYLEREEFPPSYGLPLKGGFWRRFLIPWTLTNKEERS